MRIGISSLMIQRGKTGVASYLFSLLQGFQKAATSHLFFLFVFEEDLPLFDSLKSDMSLIPVPERYRPPVRNILWHQSALPRLARHYSLDVLHVPSYRRLLWPKPCPLVATIHDLAPFHVTGKYDWKRMFYGRVVVRRLAMRQDRVIAVSHNTAADLVRFFRLREAQIKVIHNGIDHRRFTPGSAPEAKARVAHRLGLTSPFFLYVARLEHPGKNHLRLIQAFEKFKNSCKSEFQLVFAGSDWHGAEAIHRAIQNSPHKKDIRSLGFVSLEELPELYRAAEVFVYPSLFEGFGFPPLEAMACGCPVISSTRGSLEEIVGTAALTVDPENVDEMSYQLRRGALDGALRARLRAAGIERALLFDWDVAAAETLKVYQQVAKTVPATRFVRGSEAPVR